MASKVQKSGAREGHLPRAYSFLVAAMFFGRGYRPSVAGGTILAYLSAKGPAMAGAAALAAYD